MAASCRAGFVLLLAAWRWRRRPAPTTASGTTSPTSTLTMRTTTPRRPTTATSRSGVRVRGGHRLRRRGGLHGRRVRPRPVPQHAGAHDVPGRRGLQRQRVCYPREGAAGRAVPRCNDADPCTMDRCVEPSPGWADVRLPALDRDADTTSTTTATATTASTSTRCPTRGRRNAASTRSTTIARLTDALDTDCQMNFDDCTTPRELVPGEEWRASPTARSRRRHVLRQLGVRRRGLLLHVTAVSDALVSLDGRGHYVYAALQTAAATRPASCVVLPTWGLDLPARARARHVLRHGLGLESQHHPTSDQITFLIRWS